MICTVIVDSYMSNHQTNEKQSKSKKLNKMKNKTV